jgi:molecular chaperone GrpE
MILTAHDSDIDQQAKTDEGIEPEAAAETEDGNDNDNGAEDSVEQLEVELETARQDVEAAEEAMLRMQADMENLRKRLFREHEKSRKRALERLMLDLLPVRDSLELGLQAADQATTVEALKEGKQLIMKMLTKVMTDHGLETIDPAGERFDPELHEAMSTMPSPEHEENTVIDVLEKGYKLNDRLLRPAKVIVTRKP